MAGLETFPEYHALIQFHSSSYKIIKECIGNWHTTSFSPLVCLRCHGQLAILWLPSMFVNAFSVQVKDSNLRLCEVIPSLTTCKPVLCTVAYGIW